MKALFGLPKFVLQSYGGKYLPIRKGPFNIVSQEGRDMLSALPEF
jgi:hypothetical protein